MKYLRSSLRTLRASSAARPLPVTPLSAISGARALSSRASRILEAVDIPTSGEVSGVYSGNGQWGGQGDILESICPTTGEIIARVKSADSTEVATTIASSREAFLEFRNIPAPKRGDLLRQIRDALGAKRDDLGALISLEMGKIKTEGIGEVQEFLDICDYAVGLSRMMNGRVVASERPGHSILEVANPLGVLGVLSAFNFPVAVYGWNLALSLAAGNATLWKPSPTTPLCSIAVTKVISKVLQENGIHPGVASLITGGKQAGVDVVNSKDVDLVSFTGSSQVGRIVGQAVQARHGQVILELGGNNGAVLSTSGGSLLIRETILAAVVMPDADLSLAVPAVFFGGIGTAGQRCTSTRRLYLHRKIAPQFIDKLQKLYRSVKPGDPLVDGTLLGPVHNAQSLQIYEKAVQNLQATGAEILAGGSRYLEDPFGLGNFVQPTLAVPKSSDVSQTTWKEEVFAPIMNVALFDELEEAIELNNRVPQGLSSSLWTQDLRNLGKWIGPAGSDAGIVNVNVGTSGAEIGAAFGGNKSTGWGRESGGDAWKQYVRWSACTINFSDEAPLAQGVRFDV